MRTAGILGCILLLPLTLLSQPREGSPIILKRANSLSSVEENGIVRQELRGNVWMERDSLDVTCQYATYYQDSGLVIFRDNVEFRDPSRVLLADEVIYNEFTEEVTAGQRVRVYQQDTLTITSRTARYLERLGRGYFYDNVRIREERRRILMTGEAGYVDHDRQYGRVTGKPVVTERDSLSQLITEVHGDTVEYFGEQKLVRVSGNVRVERDSLVATGRTLDYYTEERMAVLLGEPEAERGLDFIHGDTMRLYFIEEQLSRVEVIGRAVATNPADSGFIEPRNRMEGKQMTLWMSAGALTEALIEGTAIATYFVREREQKKGLNVTSGDRLRVFFEDRKIARIRVEGGTEGVYTPQRLIPQ